MAVYFFYVVLQLNALLILTNVFLINFLKKKDYFSISLRYTQSYFLKSIISTP